MKLAVERCSEEMQISFHVADRFKPRASLLQLSVKNLHTSKLYRLAVVAPEIN